MRLLIFSENNIKRNMEEKAMIELAVNELTKYYGGNIILDGMTFDVQTGERVGIVGDNGCGKSTLLKIIKGVEKADEGIVSIRKGILMGYLEQMPVYPDNYTVLEVLMSAFDNVKEVQKEMEKLEAAFSKLSKCELDKSLKRYSELQEKFGLMGGYEIDENLSYVSKGLKIEGDFMSKLFSSLSGGEKTTVALGRLLLIRPGILLLDEPSNHLDMESSEWLEEYVKNYKGTVLMVSHDRYLLDAVAERIVEIENHGINLYKGNYSSYVKEKQERIEAQLADFKDQQKKIKSMEESIAQLRDWGIRHDNGKFFKRAASMEKRLNKIERIEKPETEKDGIKALVSEAARSGKEVIKIEEVWKKYGDRVLLKGANLLVRYGEKAAIIGKNGCGKSTLIKMLFGEVKEDSGKVILGESVKAAYLPQEISFKDENMTAIETFRDEILITEGKAREYLARYMFYGEDVFKKVCKLSGGERSRLKLAVMMYDELNLLVLDEPTNHLDISSREELENIIRDFGGTVLYVSHDRYFINETAERVIELSSGKLKSYCGNYEFYKSEKLKENKKEEKVHLLESENKKTKKEVRVAFIKDDQESKRKELEIDIERLEQQSKFIENEMYSITDYIKLNELTAEKNILDIKIEELTLKYLEM